MRAPFCFPVRRFLSITMLLLLIDECSGKCLKSCTTSLKSAIVSILGSSAEAETELLAPFHSVIAKSRTNVVAVRKISWICAAVEKFEECSRKCPPSTTKSLRTASVSQWATICEQARDHGSAFVEFVNCERHHIDRTARKCPFVKVSDNMALGDFCRRLQEYSLCYASVPFECSSNASEVWLRINDSIQRSFNRLLQLSSAHLRLPEECQRSMATTLPQGILPTPSTPPTPSTTPSPPPPQPTTGSRSSAERTVVAVESVAAPPEHEDTSTASDDYSYFQQTDDYKFFDQERHATPTTSKTTESAQEVDYWIDLDDPDSQTPRAQSHAERHVHGGGREYGEAGVSETETEYVWTPPEPSTSTSAPATHPSLSAGAERTPASPPLWTQDVVPWPSQSSVRTDSLLSGNSVPRHSHVSVWLLLTLFGFVWIA